MNTLEKIIIHQRQEVEELKSLYPIKLLEQSIYFNSPVVSLNKYLLRKDKHGIIAEFKHKSPSKGIINQYAPVERTTIGYMQAGANALSVLTNTEFFGGKNEDLTIARKFNYCPVLRKDFVIDEYQIIEAKSIGADAVLLIANILSAKEIESLTKTAKSIGLEVVLELHNRSDFDSINNFVDIIGINNRDLKTFEVNVNQSLELAHLIPDNFIKISESGIDSAKTVYNLKEAGFNGFLIGENFMKHNHPEIACSDFIKEVIRYDLKPAEIK